MDADTLRRRTTARATRSLTQAMRLTGEAKREALREHAALVWPHRTCALGFQSDPSA